MRTLLTARIHTEAGNEAIRNGTMPASLKKIMDELKPECAYFTPIGGRRAILIVFDMKESSQMPAIAEPLFEELDAEVTFQPVMNYDDLQKGLATLQG
ncbi:hypothetical protein [Streptomyces sp. XD-27]|uniref:hypothetical protein n=1 Tax=Streptomyces sp. XD-27 TaxID=3062779 RepID=UPI0026F46A6C|nr:hypothetical protein [Streptomyces sp. XD-27]WKX73101.1 hypothetical protein Q3Y56_27260 [Streptomyces sp. XD-27]